MTNKNITKIAQHLRRIHETTDPRLLCRCLDINIDYLPMCSGTNALKGLITRNNRCATISINSDQPEKTQSIVLFHEIGHYVLRHHKRTQVCAFHDYGISDNVSELEDEANRFVAEYLLENNETLDVLQNNCDFFKAASILHVPKEILDYKIRMLKYYKLLNPEMKECPVYSQNNFMGIIDCGGIENSDYA